MFAINFLIVLIIGLVSIVNVKRSLLLGIIYLLVIPTSNYFSSIHYNSGLMAADGFFIGLLPRYLYCINQKNYLRLDTLRRYLFASLIIFGLYLLFAMNTNIKLSNILKDLRPIILLFEMFVIFTITTSSKFTLSKSTITNIAIIAALSNIFYFMIGFVNLIQYEDQYAQNNTNRYLDLASYFSVYYVFHSQYKLIQNQINNKKKTYLATTLSLICILLTGSRIYFIATLIGIGIIRNNKLSNRIKYVFWISIALYLFIIFNEFIGQDRIKSSLEGDGFIVQLLARFEPALVQIRNMNIYQNIFGYGLGTFFDISWFEYRGLDTMNVSVDSAYLTHYVKQGVFGLFFTLVSIKFLSFTGIKKLKITFITFWVIQFLVEASMFQNVIFGICFYLCLLIKSEQLQHG